MLRAELKIVPVPGSNDFLWFVGLVRQMAMGFDVWPQAEYKQLGINDFEDLVQYLSIVPALNNPACTRVVKSCLPNSTVSNLNL